MGIVARQASRNAISIFVGTLAGAVNTIVVLPRAFEEFEEGWGLIKVLTAYALIFAQFFHGGVPNAMVRFFPRLKEDERARFLLFAFAIPLAGSALLTGLLLLGGNSTLQLVNEENSALLRERIPELAFLSVILVFFFSINGYLSARLQTTFFQFINEAFLKSWYLIIATTFLFGFIDFNILLYAYLGGYALATLALLMYSLQLGLRFQMGGFGVSKREFASYSLYSILDKGAAIVVNNLDSIMIGLIIGLQDVAYYTLAFYIGAVTMIPQKSIMAIANPIASKAIGEKDSEALRQVYQQSSLLQLFFGGLIFCGVWSSISEVMQLLPQKFSGGMWVVFWIGISRLISMMTGVSGGILVYSEHYRLNFRLNVSLIGLTALTNYFFMHPDFFNMGIEGAAIATAITFLTYNAMKVLYVKRHFKMTPFSGVYTFICLMIVFVSLLTLWSPFETKPIASILIKSTLVTAAFGVLAWRTGLIPLDLLRKR